jgi:hypothetical protein
MALWMRRLGTGTGFAGAKLSEVLPRSERSLATVRMTERMCDAVEVLGLLVLAQLAAVILVAGGETGVVGVHRHCAARGHGAG